MHSQVENTILEHHPRDTTPSALRQVLKGNEGKFYPENQDNNYISCFPESFRGYLGRSSLDYIFCACPHKARSEIQHKFFQDFWAYVPSNRKLVINSPAPKVNFTTLLHHTSEENHTLSNFFTSYPSQIIMHDKLFRGNVFRDLEYIPRWTIVRERGVTTKTNSIEPPRLRHSELRSQSDILTTIHVKLIFNIVTFLILLVLIVFVNKIYYPTQR